MLLYPLILVLLFRFCTPRDTLTVNQILTDGDVLISKESNFTLGFFSPGNSSYRYLGIWFQKVPEKTVVWVANRNTPINGTSGVLSVNQFGNLVLYNNHDPSVLVWSPKFSVEATKATVAQLLDTGNLVLVQNESKKIVWQSFDYPTDTLLPAMKIRLDWRTGLQQFLTSWKSPDDPATGEYIFKINLKGSPQIFLYKGSTPYWRTGPQPWTISLSNHYNRSFVNNEDEIYYIYNLVDTSIITRLLVDYTGLLKRLTWQNSSSQWKEFWSAPLYRCDNYGHCGAYSKCNPNNIDNFECSCLPGYEPKSPKDWYMRDGSGGCIRKRMGSSSMCGNGEGFLKVSLVKVPDTAVAAWLDIHMNRMECEQACLRNCSCTAYASLQISPNENGCLAWYGELMDTMEPADEGYDFYVRVDAIVLGGNIVHRMLHLSRGMLYQHIIHAIKINCYSIGS